MHRTPREIARSLRAFRNAHKLGLLRCVRILPGDAPCTVVRSQLGLEYLGNDVPRLPLPQCTNNRCDCRYVPIGSGQLHRLNATGKPSFGH